MARLARKAKLRPALEAAGMALGWSLMAILLSEGLWMALKLEIGR